MFAKGDSLHSGAWQLGRLGRNGVQRYTAFSAVCWAASCHLASNSLSTLSPSNKLLNPSKSTQSNTLAVIYVDLVLFHGACMPVRLQKLTQESFTEYIITPAQPGSWLGCWCAVAVAAAWVSLRWVGVVSWSFSEDTRHAAWLLLYAVSKKKVVPHNNSLWCCCFVLCRVVLCLQGVVAAVLQLPLPAQVRVNGCGWVPQMF